MQLGHSPIGKGQLSTAMEQQQQHTEVVGQFSLFVISLAKEGLSPTLNIPGGLVPMNV